MISEIAYNELLTRFDLQEYNLSTDSPLMVQVEGATGSEIEIDVYYIFEGLADISYDKKHMLCKVQVMQETLNPDFDDDDNDDPYEETGKNL